MISGSLEIKSCLIKHANNIENVSVYNFLGSLHFNGFKRQPGLFIIMLKYYKC